MYIPKRRRTTSYSRAQVKYVRKKRYGPINVVAGVVRTRGGRIYRRNQPSMGLPLTLQRYPNRRNYRSPVRGTRGRYMLRKRR